MADAMMLGMQPSEFRRLKPSEAALLFPLLSRRRQEDRDGILEFAQELAKAATEAIVKTLASEGKATRQTIADVIGRAFR